MKDAKKQTYKLPFGGLSEGEHLFDYSIDNAFLGQFDTLLEYEGSLEAKVLFFKKSQKRKLTIFISGEFQTNCDRCLESLVLEFKAEEVFYLQEQRGEEFTENEDVILITKEQQEIELSQIFYEIIILHLSYSKTHSDKECDTQMLEMMTSLKEREIKKEIDPRWAELEKLKKNR